MKKKTTRKLARKEVAALYRIEAALEREMHRAWHAEAEKAAASGAGRYLKSEFRERILRAGLAAEGLA